MTQPPGLQPPPVPPEPRDDLPRRRRRSWSRGRKRLTAGIAALGLLLVIGAIASATESGKNTAKVADPGARSTTAAAKASTRATVKAGTKAGTGATARAGTGANAKASTGAGTGPRANRSTGAGAGPSPNRGTGAGAEPSAASGTATPESSQDCSDQARAWLNGGSSQQIAALEGAFGTLYAAGNALVSAAGHGASRDIPAVEGAAGALQSAAGAVEANPGPSCVPGLRANLMSGAADYSEVASDADSAVGEYEAGQVSAAKADVDAARPLAAEATASIAAAEAAENFSG
jgi:hypothetical protein